MVETSSFAGFWAYTAGMLNRALGNESQAQAEFLLGEGSEEAQGFLYGHPLTAVDFRKVFARTAAH